MQLETEKIIQVNFACVKCGSYYRRGKICNICGTENIDIAIAQKNIYCARGHSLDRKKNTYPIKLRLHKGSTPINQAIKDAVNEGLIVQKGSQKGYLYVKQNNPPFLCS